MFLIFLSLIACAVAASTPEIVAAPSHERIVGGIVANIRSFPWQVSIQYQEEHICGGSIYNKKIIVTAAQCVYNLKDSDILVRVGSSYWNHDGELKKVAKIKIHKHFNPISLDNDIAVVRLKKKLTLTWYIQPIQLARKSPENGDSATVSGWGHTYYHGENSDELRSVTVNIISQKNCASSAYGYGSRIMSSVICAAAPDKNACRTDAGGPLIANGVLVGVFSWSIGCAESKHPGIYVDVAQFRKWIEKAAESV